jgi:hypothetical protein
MAGEPYHQAFQAGRVSRKCGFTRCRESGMRHSRDSYVRKGDQQRRLDRVRRACLFAGFVSAVSIAWTERGAQEAQAEAPTARPAARLGMAPGMRAAHAAERVVAVLTPVASGALALSPVELERWSRIYTFAGRYHITRDLAADIHDVALAEGIEPELAFRLVRVESEFKEHATSPVGAIGLTQVMPSTARYFVKGVTREGLYERRTNLKVGFRYLRTLIREYEGNVRLALLVYNRGPNAVDMLREQGLDPSNGYEKSVMGEYRGKGVID